MDTETCPNCDDPLRLENPTLPTVEGDADVNVVANCASCGEALSVDLDVTDAEPLRESQLRRVA